MKDKSKVKDKNVWKVAKIKIINPHATQREIAEKAWIARNTVIKAEQELSQNWTKDPTIAFIVDSAKNRIKNISRVLDHKTKKILDKVELDEDIENKDVFLLKDIAKDDLARVTVLWGNVTDEQGWLTKDKERWDNASVEDLLQFLKTK